VKPETPNTLSASKTENFHVLTWLVPRSLRPDFMNLYWFCRSADDLADNHDGSEAARSRAENSLRGFKAQLHSAVNNPQPLTPSSPQTTVPGLGFSSLAATIRTHNLPLSLFDALVEAFLQDQRTTRYSRWDELVRYSEGSANPVGRLVLRLLHTHTAFDLDAADPLSDHVCTALQLANFWQDVRRDLTERDRIYLPAADTGFTPERLRSLLDSNDQTAREAFGSSVLALAQRTRRLMHDGSALISHLPPAHRPLIRLFIAGGNAILNGIVHARGQTLWHRPRVSKPRRAALLLRESARRLIGT
jgi:squalene synthase HpnC